MSEHAWTVDNLAAYVAGGLDGAEREQLERHAAACPDCTRALAAARAADHKLLALFAGDRPGPALEDRMVRTLRQPARSQRWPVWAKAVLATAAVALLAITGATVGALVDESGGPTLRSYGFASSRMSATNNLRQIPIADAGQKGTAWHDGNAGEGFGGKHVDPILSFEVDPGMVEFDTDAARLLMRKDETSVPGQISPKFPDINGAVTELGEEAWKAFPVGPGSNTNNGLLGNAVTKKLSGDPPAVRMPLLAGEAHTLGKEGAKVPPAKEPAGGGTPPLGFEYFKPGQVFLKGSTARPKPPKDVPVNEPAAKGGDVAKDNGKDGKDGEAGGRKQPPEPGVPDAGPGPQKIIIRSGDVEYEVDSFDAALAAVQKLVGAVKGAYIATVNRTRLENGKTRGSVVARIPPDRIDQLLLDLRTTIGKTGELKGQRIGSQDITKQYTDLQSRLRAARAMEERLLRMIKDGKGAIKDLLDAEKELGVWRTRIEESEGELRYYGNLVSLSSLTISLTEKEIRVAAAVSQVDCVQTQVEVEDVEAAMQKMLKAVEDAKGRVTRSELKQEGTRQLTAVLEFEVPPKEAGMIRVALRQLGGTVAQLKVDRVQRAEGGAKLPRNGRLDQGDTEFRVLLYNLAKVQPRETVVMKVAAPDVAAAYRALRTALEKPIKDGKARVTNADLNEQDRQNVGAHLEFEIHWTEQKAVLTALGDAGEVLARHVTRAPESENVTDKKVLYRVELLPATAIEPRKTVTLAVEVSKVEQALSVLTAQVKEEHGRIVKGPVTALDRNGRTSARVVYDVPLSVADAIVEKAKNAGQVRVSNVAPNPQAPEGKLALARIDVSLATADVLVPREEGVGAYLSVSLRALSLSVSWLIVGVLFVLPWLLVIAAIVWLVRRLQRRAPTPPLAG